MSKVLIIGSYAADLVSRADRLPLRGETVSGSDFSMGHGGKGSNQAVAANRLGCDVTFISRVGDDDFGKKVKEFYASEGLNTLLITDPVRPTGTALICVEESTGANQILMVPGACGAFTREELDSFVPLIKECDYLLLQMEINIDALEYVIELASGLGTKVILNTAPVRSISERALSLVYMVTPNEHEAAALTGISVDDDPSAALAAAEFHKKGIEKVLITLGSAGSYFSDGNGEGRHFPAFPVRAVDSTGAGDVFNGGLVTALSEGKDIPEAIEFASKAASVSVTRQGAALSAPLRCEII